MAYRERDREEKVVEMCSLNTTECDGICRTLHRVADKSQDPVLMCPALYTEKANKRRGGKRAQRKAKLNKERQRRNRDEDEDQR